MRRIVLSSLVLAGAGLAPAAHAAHAAAPAPAGTAARAPRALVATCDRTRQAAVFEGRMDAVPQADRMQMRFSLQVSTPDEPDWTRLAVPGFSTWVTSEPGRSRYLYSKRVESLLAPAGYRVQIRFRWLAADGTVVRGARAASKPCRQPDPRADLRVVALGAGPDGAGLRYAVAVRNAGRSAAPASTLRLELAGGSAQTAAVPPIAAGGREEVFLSGPACRPHDRLTAIADADDAVDERDEANAFTLACPSA
jgi:hypothetical protein